MPVPVIVINSNNDDDDDDKEEVPRAASAPLSAVAGGARRQRGGPGGGRGGGCCLPPQNKRERRRWRERLGRTEGIVPRCAAFAGGFARGTVRQGQSRGLAGWGDWLSTGAVGENVSGRGCGGAGNSRSTRGRSAEGQGGEGVYRPVRGGGSIPEHPTAASSGRCSVGSPRVGSRWMRPSRDPATDTSFSSPLDRKSVV